MDFEISPSTRLSRLKSNSTRSSGSQQLTGSSLMQCTRRSETGTRGKHVALSNTVMDVFLCINAA